MTAGFSTTRSFLVHGKAHSTLAQQTLSGMSSIFKILEAQSLLPASAGLYRVCRDPLTLHLKTRRWWRV